VVGGGFCNDHLDIELNQQQSDEISRIAATCSYLNGESVVL
jgi:hypothetical protein